MHRVTITRYTGTAHAVLQLELTVKPVIWQFATPPLMDITTACLTGDVTYSPMLLVAALLASLACAHAPFPDPQMSVARSLGVRIREHTHGQLSSVLCGKVAAYACDWAHVDKNQDTNTSIFSEFVRGEKNMHEDTAVAAAIAHGALRALLDKPAVPRGAALPENPMLLKQEEILVFHAVAEPCALLYTGGGVERMPIMLLAADNAPVSLHVVRLVVNKLRDLDYSNMSCFQRITYRLVVQYFTDGKEDSLDAFIFWVQSIPSVNLSAELILHLVEAYETCRLRGPQMSSSSYTVFISQSAHHLRVAQLMKYAIKNALAFIVQDAIDRNRYQDSLTFLVKSFKPDFKFRPTEHNSSARAAGISWNHN